MSGEGSRPARTSHYCAETVGNTLYVSGGRPNYMNTDFISCYDLERHVWKTHPYSVGTISNMCTVGDYLYTFASNCQSLLSGIVCLRVNGRVLQTSRVRGGCTSTIVEPQHFILMCLFFMEKVFIKKVIITCEMPPYIVLITWETCEKKKHQPAIFILGPVFL